MCGAAGDHTTYTDIMACPLAAHFRLTGHNISLLRYINIWLFEKLKKPSRGGDYKVF